MLCEALQSIELTPVQGIALILLAVWLVFEVADAVDRWTHRID